MNAPAFWLSRSPRERAVLAWTGVAIVAILLFAFVWLPMERARTRLAQELPPLRASLAEMRAQAGEVKALRALPARDAAPATPLATLVASGSLAQGLPGARVAALDARRASLTVDDASWARLVEWLHWAGASHGLAVDEAMVEALPAPDRVRARLVLSAAP
jgi:type II secretory pathway component PulM